MGPRLAAALATMTVLTMIGGSGGCAGRTVEGWSRLGEPLSPPRLDRATREKFERNLAAARAAYEANPTDEDAIIWLGRRQAYLGRYREAIETFTRGLAVKPDSYKLRRHRGHRFISLRRLGEAVADLDTAALLIADVPDEVEPDGLPNALNMPTSTSHTNIYYHLGLGRYLQGNFGAARAAWQRCLEFSANDDMRCATVYWLYLSARREGDFAGAMVLLEPIHGEMTIIENHDYHRLLLLFKGAMTEAEVLAVSAGDDGVAGATVGYGVGMWRLMQGDRAGAEARWWQVLEDADAWPAFGFIAAEAELAGGTASNVSCEHQQPKNQSPLIPAP